MAVLSALLTAARRFARRPLLLTALFAAAACGLGGGGGELVVSSFPQSGLGPFRLFLPEEAPGLDAPYLLQPPGIDVDDPSALPLGDGDGDGLRLFVTAQRRGAPAASFIGRAVAAPFPAGTMAATIVSDLSEALAADRPWEGGLLHHPTIVGDLPGLVGAGVSTEAEAAYALFYQGQDGSLGLATSSDGERFRKGSDRPLFPAVLAGGEVGDISPVILPPLPAASQDSGSPGPGGMRTAPLLRLYLLAGGRRLLRADAPLDAALRAGAGGGDVPWQVTPLSSSAADFAVSLSSSESVPAERLLSLSVRRIVTPAGRERFDLLVVAEAGQRRTATGAASYDGVSFSALSRPLLGRAPGLPSALAVIMLQHSGRALLLLGQRPSAAAQSGIAVGRIP